MNEQLYLQPAAGLRVVDPLTGKPLPPEGAWVAPSTHWLRRLGDGDVVEAEPPPAADQAAVQTETEAPAKPARNK